jgi:predicted PurR-regulated permease PerM
VGDRIVEIRTRTLLRILGVIVGVALLLQIIWISRQVITWILIAIFLSLALDPLVNYFQARTGLRRSGAIGLSYLTILLVVVGVGATFVPTLVDEVNGFIDATPGYVEDLTEGRGRLGFLETKYHIVETVREEVERGDAAKRLLGLSDTALAVTRGILTMIVATLTIVFLTFFLLLEGRAWMDRFYSLLPERSQPRWRRLGSEIYKTIGGYVTGNLLISLVAGTSATIVLALLGVPYAVALGLLVAILDLIPLAGATIAGVVVTTVAFLHSVPAGVTVLVFVILYQQLENHVLQPLIYGRTVQLSPLVVLIAILIGAELAGVLGALAAIPVAGSIQVILRDILAVRRARNDEAVALPP